MTHTDITPVGSFAPIMLDPVATQGFEVEDLSAGRAAQDALRESGRAKLMALGLTEEEALAIVG